MSVSEKMTVIADNIRAKTGGTEKLNLDQMASAVDEVYEAGKKAEYDILWDTFQQNGKRTDYRYFFFQTMFTHIDPKHQIRASNSDSMFGNAASIETVNWEKFDLTNTSSLYNAFGYCIKLQSVDTDLAASVNTATVLNSIFRNCNALVRVKK